VADATRQPTTHTVNMAARTVKRTRRRSPFAGPVRRFMVLLPLVALVLWTIGPFLVSLSVSFKQPAHVFSDPGLIPDQPTLDAYARVLDRPGFRSALWNSVVIAFGSLILTLLVGIPAAYAFARFRFRGRHLLLLFSLLPMLVPKVGLMYPLFLLAVEVGGFDSRIFLILVFTGMLLPLAVWLMVGYFQAIPRELEEAARGLGARRLRRVLRLELPLMAPGLLAGAGLVLLSAMKELPATLLLAPPGFHTLATMIWSSTEDAFLADASIASLVLIGLSGFLTWLLVLRGSPDP
jgi:ABC-type glycerol-3-phosphate transport system permease component